MLTAATTVLARDSIAELDVDVGFRVPAVSMSGARRLDRDGTGSCPLQCCAGDAISYEAAGDITLAELDASMGSITVDAGSALTLSDNLTAGTTVDLTAGGTINQTAGGIVGDTLTYNAGGAVTLASSLNDVDTASGTGTDVTLVD